MNFIDSAHKAILTDEATIVTPKAYVTQVVRFTAVFMSFGILTVFRLYRLEHEDEEYEKQLL